MILFSDLDGTLLNTQKEITPATMEAIGRMVSLGHKFVLATGRPIQSALPLAEAFGFVEPGFYIVSYNGGLIYDCYEKKTLYKASVPLGQVRYIFDRAKEAGLHCHTYTKTHILSERETDELRAYQVHIKMPAKIVENVLDALDEPPLKLIVMDKNGREKLELFHDRLLSWGKDKVNSVFSSPTMLEYGPKTASKGNALLFLCDHFHIPVSESVAAGDEGNDLSMIRAAGTGAVMKNGTDEVKRYADYITENDNDHDGMAEIIERLILKS